MQMSFNTKYLVSIAKTLAVKLTDIHLYKTIVHLDASHLELDLHRSILCVPIKPTQQRFTATEADGIIHNVHGLFQYRYNAIQVRLW